MPLSRKGEIIVLFLEKHWLEKPQEWHPSKLRQVLPYSLSGPTFSCSFFSSSDFLQRKQCIDKIWAKESTVLKVDPCKWKKKQWNLIIIPLNWFVSEKVLSYLKLIQIVLKYCLVCDIVLPRVWLVALALFYHLALWILKEC